MIKKTSGKPEIEITIDKVESLVTVQQAHPAIADANNLTTLGKPSINHPQVYYSAESIEIIDAHTQSDTVREVGGFLVGQAYEWEGQYYIEVVTALPGRLNQSGPTFLTIRHDTWVEALNTISAEYPHYYIVGWYHTHPGLGVFMSAMDIDIHKGYFTKPWHIAMVIDPHVRDAGAFVWDNEKKLVPANGYHLIYPSAWPDEHYWELPKTSTVYDDTLPIMSMVNFFDSHVIYREPKRLEEPLLKIDPTIIEMACTGARSRLPSTAQGICFGRIYRCADENYRNDLVDIETIRLVESATDDGSNQTESLRKLSAIVKSEQIHDRTPLGWCYIGDPPFVTRVIVPSFLRYRHFFRRRWQITLYVNVLTGEPQVEVILGEEENNEGLLAIY